MEYPRASIQTLALAMIGVGIDDEGLYDEYLKIRLSLSARDVSSRGRTAATNSLLDSADREFARIALRIRFRLSAPFPVGGHGNGCFGFAAKYALMKLSSVGPRIFSAVIASLFAATIEPLSQRTAFTHAPLGL